MSFSSDVPPTAPSSSSRPEPDPIILPGFDYDEQLRLDFSSPHFSPAWMRRTYTREKDPHLVRLVDCNGRLSRDSAMQAARYGNNITVLFRACYRLSAFYGSPGFWPAIASGFSIGAHPTEAMVDRFVRARRIYCDRYPGDRGFFSGATKAADSWIRFIDYEGEKYRPSSSKHDSAQGTARLAADYYEDSKTRFLQVDAAAVLSRRGIEDTQRPKRKRSPSPTPLVPPSATKRRLSSDYPTDWYEKQTDQFAPSIKASRPPFATDIEKPGQETQEYPTSLSGRAHLDQHAPSPQVPSGEQHERKIRGITRQDSCSSIPAKIVEPSPDNEDILQSSEGRTVLSQVKKQDAVNVPSESSRSTNIMTQNPIATAERSTESRVVELMQARISSLEQQLLKTQAEREKNSVSMKTLIDSFENRMVELGESRSAQAILMQKMQAKLAVMESNPASRDHSASVEQKTSINNALESTQNEMRRMQDRLTTLEDQGESLRRTIRGLSQTQTNVASPTPPEDMQRSMEEVYRRLKALPTMPMVSEKMFQIERHMRDIIQEYQRNNDDRVQGAIKDLETVRAQIRELTKQFDKATSYLPAKASLLAVEDQVARLGKDVGSLRESKAQASQLLALEGKVDQLSTLEGTVDKLSAELHDNTMSVSLSDRIQELSSRTDSLEKQMGSVPEEAAQEELNSVNARLDLLTQSFLNLLSKLHRTGANTSALESSTQPSSPNTMRMNGTPVIP